MDMYLRNLCLLEPLAPFHSHFLPLTVTSFFHSHLLPLTPLPPLVPPLLTTRAFLRNPRLLVCDEATSALDSATEASIMASLKELAQVRGAHLMPMQGANMHKHVQLICGIVYIPGLGFFSTNMTRNRTAKPCWSIKA